MSLQEECLVLLADNDQSLCSAVSKYLSSVGIKTALAYDGLQAMEMLEQIRPHVVVADLKMPKMDGLEFLKNAGKMISTTPVIITALDPDLDVAVKTVQSGAYDYILKPYQFELLLQKINQAIKSTRLMRENFMLNEMVSLYDITTRLTTTHNLDELLDITFQFCLEVSEAESGSLQLIDRENQELVMVRQKAINSSSVRSSLADLTEWTISKWVFTNGKSLLLADGKTTPETGLNFSRQDISSALSVPIKVSGETIGVVNLNRTSKSPPFNLFNKSVIDVLASQAGVAINNANLYHSINQKLDELMLISSYSERLMGLVDKYDVIRCLYETAIRNFPLDFMGFLVAQRRTHEFMYWSRGEVEDDIVREIRREVIESFNTAVSGHISERKVFIRRIQLSTKTSGYLKLPLAFRYVMPVVWEDLKFGAIFFGSSREMPGESEKKALLSSLVSQTRIALTNSKLYSDMKENYIRTIKALAIAVDAKDTYTHGHSENVMNIAEEIAREMRIDEKNVGIIRDAGLLHDIGKIGIPGYILNKPGPLTYEEFNGIMKTHSTLGANIVKDVPFLHDLHDLILHHHEHYNGGGYPDNLKEDQIPIGARILHVADAFEAMTSNRPYRDSLGKKEAIKRLIEGSGKQFDPIVIKAFLRVASRKNWLDENSSLDEMEQSQRQEV
ncbi:MAG: HD domain-containing protein [Fibrobacter sp.]|jgi:putative nucleotidyltransferase with HDIG domain|nr:HD domain-containing protein [Fibrobacter sp.]